MKSTVRSDDWGELLQAGSKFWGDLYLVHSPTTPKVSPLSAPYMEGTYSLTNFSLTDEAAFLKHYGGKKVVVLVGCMDKRYARLLFNWTVDTHPRQFVLPIFVAAGIAQDGDPDRLNALKTISQYCLRKLNVVKVIAAGHNCGCGGVAHIRFQGKKTVYQGLNCLPGSQRENDFMKGVINVSVNQIFDKKQRRIVEKLLVAQQGEKIDFLTFR